MLPSSQATTSARRAAADCHGCPAPHPWSLLATRLHAPGSVATIHKCRGAPDCQPRHGQSAPAATWTTGYCGRIAVGGTTCWVTGVLQRPPQRPPSPLPRVQACRRLPLHPWHCRPRLPGWLRFCVLQKTLFRSERTATRNPHKEARTRKQLSKQCFWARQPVGCCCEGWGIAKIAAHACCYTSWVVSAHSPSW